MTIALDGTIDDNGLTQINDLNQLYTILIADEYFAFNKLDWADGNSHTTKLFLDAFGYDLRHPAYMQGALATSRGFGDAYGAAEMHLRKSEGLRRSSRLASSELVFAQLPKPLAPRDWSPLTYILSFFKPKPL